MIEDFQEHHLEGFEFREEDLLYDCLECTDKEKFIKSCEGSTTYVVNHNGKILSFIGAIEVMRGNSYIWQTPCRDFEKYLKPFVIGLRQAMDKYIKDHKQHRLYTICRDEKKFYDWMTKGVGFELECILEKYGENAENYVQFKKVVR